MVNVAKDTFKRVDILLLLVEAAAGVHPADPFIIKSLPEGAMPVILVINKIDLVKKTQLLPLIDQLHLLHPFAAIVPLSARTGDGLSLLTAEILQALPEGPACFPEDTMTDCPERFIAAEIIREKIILLTRQEIPMQRPWSSMRSRRMNRSGLSAFRRLSMWKRIRRKGF